MEKTDKAMLDSFKSEFGKAKNNVGRPQVNRELAYQLLASGRSTQYIRRILHCSARTIRMLRNEMRAKGIGPKPLSEREIDKAAREFDYEAKEEYGCTFLDWLRTRMKPDGAQTYYNWIRTIWETLFDKASFFSLKNRDDKAADDCAMKWLDKFQQDKTRLRRRKKRIRFFFRFLGRQDINDKYFTMSKPRDPIEKRLIPEIELIDFPTKFSKALEYLPTDEHRFIIKFKCKTKMRTGFKDRQELYGLKIGITDTGSYLVMNSVDDWVCKIKAKAGEEYDITWIPEPIRKELWEIYQRRNTGEYLIKIHPDEIIRLWKGACVKAGLPPLTLHDLRKIGLTWDWVIGVPLEIAVMVNCGWKDFNTAKDFYLHYRKLLTKDKREQYKANIPHWFREGIDQYV